MIKKTKFTSIVILTIVALFSLTECAKDLTNGKLANTSDAITPNLLPGPCPYGCHDVRCKAYQGGYCGPVTTTPDTVAVIKNPNNPYDTVGNRHNNGIRAILPYYQGGIEPTTANSWSYTTSYLENYGYSSSILGIIEDTMVNRYDTSLYSMTVNGCATYLYNSGLISAKLEGYINDLGNLVNAISDTANTSNYENFANGVISLESTIIADSTLSSTEKQIILSGASVARYSTSYWMNFTTDTSSSSEAIVRSNSIQPQVASGGGGSWFSWKPVVGGDVVGAVAGGVGGAVTGAITGPGVVICAGAGAAGGAVTSSIYEAGMQVWKHWFG